LVGLTRETRSARRCLGCERVVRIAGIHKLASGVNLLAFSPTPFFPNCKIPQLRSGLKLRPQPLGLSATASPGVTGSITVLDWSLAALRGMASALTGELGKFASQLRCPAAQGLFDIVSELQQRID
jgi:hypothetical protein